MIKKTTICKIVNASLAFLVSVLPVASAMDSKPEGVALSHNAGRLRDHNYYRQELRKLEESTRRIHEQVDRILAEFRRNMEEYRRYTGTESTTTTASKKVHSTPSNIVPFKGNWTGSFRLKNGETASHTPQGIKFGSFSHDREFNSEGKMTYNGSSLGKFHLATDSTREEFIAALKASGLY